MWHVTPVRLMATAGLRLLPESQREGVLESVRSALGSSGFAFRVCIRPDLSSRALGIRLDSLIMVHEEETGVP